MTGFGRGTSEVSGRRVIVEMRSVNHRFLEVKLRGTFAEAGLEQRVTALLRTQIDRGALHVTLRDEGGASAESIRTDVALAQAYATALEEVRVAIGAPVGDMLALVASQPGVLSTSHATADPDELWAALEPAVSAAAKSLITAREREGAALSADLGMRIGHLEAHAAELQQLTADSPQAHKKRLHERLARLLDGADVDPQRLAQEVALFADRVDVAEELTRLAAHLVEARRLVESERGPTGRRLDFLTQELHREINTIGSKSQSAACAARVVEAKAELERLREQVQNVE